MGFITSNQGRPIQGVSQQPDKNRYPGQCTASNNFRPDVVKGLSTRPGTQFTGTFPGASQNTASKWHHYKRNDEEYFIEIQPDGTMQAWSPDGTAHTITVEDSAGDYLACLDPSTTLKAVTIGDYTFFINTETTVEAGTAVSDSLPAVAVVYVQYMDYSQQQQVWVDGSLVAWHSSCAGSTTNHNKSVVPSTVAAHLAEGMTGVSGGGSYYGDWGGTDITDNYTIEQNGNCVYVTRIDGSDFDIYVNDDVNNANAIALYKQIEQVTLLPNKAPVGFKIEVNPPGGETSSAANYWLEATSVDGSSGNTLTWNETIEPEVVLGYNLATMPHVLVRESVSSSGVASFTLRQGEWEDREVGNDDSNPLPTFVDDQIKTMGLMQNRLYVTAGESVIMSRSSHFFNFFRATAQESLDTDPIDVYADSKQINHLMSSTGFDGDLVFFSESAQFLIPGDTALTADNAVLRKTTNFETNLDVDPVASGDSIFFAINYGQYTGIREYFTDSVTDTKHARPITDHIKEYIPGSPEIMIASTNLNLLLIKTSDSDNVLYAYDWLWQGTDKAQSAWGKWTYQDGDKILHLAFVDDTLRMIFLRDGNKVTCESVDLGDTDSYGLTFPVRLDRHAKNRFIYNAVEEVWKMTDPFPDVDVDNIKIVRSGEASESELGTLVNFERQDDELWTYDDLVDIELTTGSFCYVLIGVPFKCSYTPTNPVPKDQNDQAMNLDRLVVGAFYINYNTTGEMTAIIEDSAGNQRTQEFNGRTMGEAGNIIGFATLTEGQHRIPIRKKSDKYTLTIETESHIPLAISDFSFNGNLKRRGQRI